ncbi:MAG: hypothetical protein MUO62_09375, partial [Anaerolineales bacterium]|nr:hypothetical protein [Anaerolineales bacterium]
MTIETQKDKIKPQDEALSPMQEPKKPALTVVIQSWTTPIIGIIMLVAGLFAGFYGRPLLSPETTAVGVEGNTSTGSSSAPIIVPTPDADRTAQQQELMNAVVEGTRHLRGNP